MFLVHFKAQFSYVTVLFTFRY